MPASGPHEILDAFDLGRRRSVYLIGGGGKTTLMFALAHELKNQGRSVITTTSTKICFPSPAESSRVLTSPDLGDLIGRVSTDLETHRHVTLAAARLKDDKLSSLTVNQLDRLADVAIADHLLVEADGSAGRSIKAHAPHEPVVSKRANLVIAVIGVDCLGLPMTDEHVHRAELFRARLGRSSADCVTANDVAAFFFHEKGYLAKVAKSSDVMVFLSKVHTSAQRAAAAELAQILLRHDRDHRLGRVVAGDVLDGSFWDIRIK
jgi:probable selenium-dependent hydroxylase accessory protein YqeC